MNKIVGIVLVVLGVIGLAYGSLTFTTKEKVIDIGPIEATRDKSHTLPLPPIIGAIALIGGIAVLMTKRT